MVGMSNCLFEHNPALEAQWRSLGWKALSYGARPLNTPSEFVDCRLRQLVKPPRPFLTPPDELEQRFADLIRHLLAAAYHLWSATFFSRERVPAKLPEPEDGDEIKPHMDPEYIGVSLFGNGDRTVAGAGAAGVQACTTFELWPEIAIARTPHASDRAQDYLEVVYTGKALDGGSEFLQAPQWECGK